MNPIFTKNLLDSVVDSGLVLEQIVVMGSAAEYGIVNPEEEPVAEEVPSRATSPYGVSKINETSVVADYRAKFHLPVVTARVFNPIGAGMPERQLIPRILGQIHEIKKGNKDSIEVSRLDSERDYIDVSDVASAISALLKAKPKEAVYNIGTGHKTSNGELVNLLVKYSGLSKQPEIIETQADKEPLFASQADIGRISREFGWSPEHDIEQVVKEIVYADKDK
jgi:GDP-4-dehydro-6-deoxy-D-mannose reductase